MKALIQNLTFLNELNQKIFNSIKSETRATKFQVIEYSEQDYSKYVEICQKCPPDYEIPQYHLKTKKYFESFINRTHNKFLLLKANDEFIGCASIKKLNDHCFYFGDLKIIPEYRGKGLAEKLFNERLKRIKQKNYYILMSTIDGKKRVNGYLKKLRQKGINFYVYKKFYTLTDFPLKESTSKNIKNLILDKQLNKSIYLGQKSFITKLKEFVIKTIMSFGHTKYNNKKSGTQVKVIHTNYIKENIDFDSNIKAIRAYAYKQNSDLIIAYSSFYPICSSSSIFSSITKINFNVYRHNYNGKINIPLEMANI